MTDHATKKCVATGGITCVAIHNSTDVWVTGAWITLQVEVAENYCKTSLYAYLLPIGKE